MDKRTTGIVATVAAVLLCGCPGLISLCMGAMFAVIGMVPGADIDIGGSSDPQSAIMFGLVALCLGVIFVAIPIVVGFLTLRQKPAPAPLYTSSSDFPTPPPPPPPPSEPIPPAS